jgi:hypothetical protein
VNTDTTLRGPEGGRAPGEGSVTSSPSFHPCARTKYRGASRRADHTAKRLSQP